MNLQVLTNTNGLLSGKLPVLGTTTVASDTFLLLGVMILTCIKNPNSLAQFKTQIYLTHTRTQFNMYVIAEKSVFLNIKPNILVLHANSNVKGVFPTGDTAFSRSCNVAC